jgi:hypothetical protein
VPLWAAPVYRLIACAARPCGVSTTMSEAGLVPYEDLSGAEGVTVGAAGRWLGYPLPVGRSDELTLNSLSALPRHGSGRHRRAVAGREGAPVHGAGRHPVPGDGPTRGCRGVRSLL